MSEPQDFVVLGKVTQPPEMGGGIQYVCRIDQIKWWVPDDLANTDRQRVQVWLDDGKPCPDLTQEEAANL